MITFAIHGYEGVNPVGEFGPLQAAFEQRGIPGFAHGWNGKARVETSKR